MVVDRLRLPPERSALTGMEDFANILQRDYGLKPQGKAAPMSGAARGLNPGDKASGSGSRRDIAAAAAAASGGSFLGRGARNGGISARGSGLDAHNAEESADRDTFVGSGSASGSGSGGGGGYGRSHNSDDPFGASSASGYDDVFGGPPKYASPKFPKPPTMPKTSNLPSFDKPLYDNDIFGGVPGIRTSAPVFDDVFSSQSAPAPSSDDLLAGYPPAEDRKPSSTRHPSRGHVSYAPAGRDSVFDDLLSAGESSRPPGIRNVDTRQSQHVGREQPISRNDPFDEPTGFVDPIISIMQQTAAVGLDSDGSVSSSGDGFPHIASERPSQSSLKGGRQKVTSDPILDSSFREGAGVSSAGSDVHQPSVSPTARADAVLAEEFWVTIDDVALVTHPSTLPPPTRKAPVARQDRFQASAQDGLRHKNHVSEQSAGISRQAFVQEVDGRQSFHQTATTSRVPPAAAEAVAAAAASGIEGLEEFVSGVLYKAGGSNASEDAGTVPDGSGSQVAMQEAMERAEVKLRFAKEAREREREGKQREAMIARAQAREKEEREAREEKLRIAREKQEREREAREERERDRQKIEQLKEREREEKERERRRIEQQKEREREERERERQRIEEQREREREREKDRAAERAAVERAAAEARERTAAEARERAERAAVERATLEARERATRAAAERAAAEARERAAAEARERAAAEARERAADRAAAERAKDQQRRSDNDLDRLFSTRANSEPRQRPANSDSPADMRQSQAFGNDAQLRRASSSMPGVKKVPSSANMGDDWTSLFTQPSQEEFQEIEGETPERRQARWERHHRTLERASKALAEKNQRDLEMQREQAEKHRAGEVLDTEIKRWAAGKEGNLRALLSTLQYVLWPECGWQPVSLADLITGVAVKKAYRKATLCVHPDKVQQKGANVQQKYIAEKVFDLLKEGWNKFNSEELF